MTKYDEMKVPELRSLCKEQGLSRYAHAKKADLIEMLLKNEKISKEPDWESKMNYINKVEKGTIIAFNVKSKNDVKVKSAKVIKKSTKENVLKCVTSYGKEYIVKFEEVIWVKTGSRWPRGVYNLLKGIKDEK